LGKALGEEVPEVEKAVSIIPASWFREKGTISKSENKIKVGGEFVSKDYFDVFTCKFIQGDQKQLFKGNNYIAISRELALKLFGSTQNVIGKPLKWELSEFSGTYTVAGIFEKTPANATAQFDVLLNYELALERLDNWKIWTNSDPDTYVLLRKNVNPDVVNKKITQVFKKYNSEAKKTFFLERFSDSYLYNNYENGVQVGGRIGYVKLFSIIAIVILIIACINFMNLSTAKASRRIKEVGIKKVSGASRTELVFQYLGESMMMAYASLILGIILIIALLSLFNDITGKQIALNFSAGLMLSILGITFITGLIAGSYPAFYISGFNPAAVLKGKLKSTAGELFIRKGLVIFQFTLSVIFIAIVMVVYRQIGYIQSKNLGYNRDHLVHFEIPLVDKKASMSAGSAFVEELRGIPGVLSAGSFAHNLMGQHGSIGGVQWPGKDPDKNIDFANLEMGSNFLQTAGIDIAEGRNFSPDDRAMDEIVFNEAAIKEMGLKDPIGKQIKFWDQTRTIVGVAKDFNFESMYSTVTPAFFQIYPVMPNILVRLKAGTEKETLERIHKKYAEFNKGMAFEYTFMDDDYQALYSSEMKIGILSRYFAALAILISCLGLFGLAAFTAQKRQKEIGIRKVVGASVTNVVAMLSGDFIKLIIVSMLIAGPVAWYMIHQWLNGFAYRTDVPWWLFAVIAILVLAIAFATISFQAIKAAIMNPVKSLRTE
jgi:putative ABC transport system permease protein